MKLENEVHEFELIARAFQKIAKEISYECLAEALLTEALGYCGAVARRCSAKRRGGVACQGRRKLSS